MKKSFWLWLSLLPATATLGCDALSGNNPNNCVLTPSACDADSVCNTYTKRCQPLVQFVLGQEDDSSNANLAAGLTVPTGVTLLKRPDGTEKVLVSDCGNNRVLIWNTFPTRNLQPPDVVVGQPDFVTNLPNGSGIGQAMMSCPNSLIVDAASGQMVVSDNGNNRMLIFPAVPTVNFARANFAWGQALDITGAPNNGMTNPSAFSVFNPSVSQLASKLVITDTNNHRVIILPTIPTMRVDPATVLLGQTAFTQSTAGALATVMNSPSGTATYEPGTKTFAVADTGNNRVLVWKSAIVNRVPADFVLGQPDFTSSGAYYNNTGDTSRGLGLPLGVFAFGTMLWVSDGLGQRVLGWKLPITTSGVPADVVLGQRDFTTLPVNPPSAQSFLFPGGIAANAAHFLVADQLNHRVLIWNSPPDMTLSGRPADLVLGQPNLNTNAANNIAAVSERTLSSPRGLTTDGTRFIVADQGNNRVLLFPAAPTSLDDVQTPQVLGQPDVRSNLPNLGVVVPSRTGMSQPSSVHSDGTALAVSDQNNHRVLFWSSVPQSSQQPPDAVLGQPNDTSGDENAGATNKTLASNSSLRGPSWVHLADQRLYVADTSNNRVLIWDLPLTDNKPASLALGQVNFANSSRLPPQAGGLNAPSGIDSDDQFLYVADQGNNRVLLYKKPISNMNQLPVRVLGATDFTDIAANRTDSTTLSGPGAVYLHKGRLFISDSFNHRVLYWNSTPLGNGQAADGVIGQPNFNAGMANAGGLSRRVLTTPYGLFATRDALYIADTGNSRLVVASPPFP